MNENEISRLIVQCTIEVHRTLGSPGLLESVYEEALCWELQHTGLEVHRPNSDTNLQPAVSFTTTRQD